MATLVSVGTGLIGTLVGAAIAWLAGRRQHHVETTYAMHQEFHAAEMTKSSGLAGKTVRKHYPKNYDDLRRDLPPKKHNMSGMSCTSINAYGSRLSTRNIYTKNVPEMFGENFWWWYQKQLNPEEKSKEEEEEEEEEEGVEEKKKKGLNWQAAQDIEELWTWMNKEADPGHKKRWHERAMEMADPM